MQYTTTTRPMIREQQGQPREVQTEKRHSGKRRKRRPSATLLFVTLVAGTIMLYCCCCLLLVMRLPKADARPRKWRFSKQKEQVHVPLLVPPIDTSEMVSNRWHGIVAVFYAHPFMLIGVVIRIAIAITLELVLDGFLKTVVTPAIAATGIGALVAPLTFLIGQALQPIIHSIAFLVFDDKFLHATLEATGIKERLITERQLTKGWHRMTFFQGMITRYVMKSMASWCLGLAGLCTMLPVVGYVLTAFLSGWVVAWDYVYVALAGMGYIGPRRQFQTVWRNFGEYQWFGFWAVLIEEIPFIGPACHVYNVYSAAFFLERLYLLHGGMIHDDDATVSTVDSDYSFKEL